MRTKHSASLSLAVIAFGAVVAISLPTKLSVGAEPLVEEALEMIRAMLKDPVSVRFAEARLAQGPKGPTVCGRYLARNSYGALNGWQGFIVGGEPRVAFLQESSVYSWNNLSAALCK